MTTQDTCKLLKNYLDLLTLTEITMKPIHGYGLIASVRKKFGAYFGPSTMYPLLNSLENKGYLKSEWKMKPGKPKKVYEITESGKKFLRRKLPKFERAIDDLGNYLERLKKIDATANLFTIVGIDVPEQYAQVEQRKN